MRKLTVLAAIILLFAEVKAQKKPLDHTVYDGWQSIQERVISNDGKYVAYTINPQEGDGILVIQSTNGGFKKEIPRGYNVAFSNDNQYLFLRLRPLFKDTREARIKKKRPDDMPKDSLGIYIISSDKLEKIAGIRSYKTPEKGAGWLAYQMDKALPEAPRRSMPDSATQLTMLTRMADSLLRVADSLKNKVTEAQTKGLSVLRPKTESRPSAPRPAQDPVEEGTELVVRNTGTGKETKFKLVTEYYFSKNGNTLLVETSRKNGDTLSKAAIIWVDLANGKTDTILKGFNDAKNYAMNEEGSKIAFVAERDSIAKALKKFYKLWYYRKGMAAAELKIDRNTSGVGAGLTVSPDFPNNFSKDGTKLFVGLANIRQTRDTGLVDFETARLDVWHYNDDNLQPQQLLQAQQELRRSYLNVWHEDQAKLVSLADENCEMVITGNEGNAAVALGMTSKGYRVQNQWEQTNFRKLYVVNVVDGTRKFIADKVRGQAALTPDAKYVLWYDWKQKNYFAYSIANGNTINLTKDIKTPLFDEDDDHPDDPPPHGFMGFDEGDQYFYVYDKYDIWKVDLSGTNKPVCITNGLGRKTNHTYRYIRTDRDERFIKDGQMMLLNVFDHVGKGAGMKVYKLGASFTADAVQTKPASLQGVIKAKDADNISFLMSTPQQSPNMYTSSISNMNNTLELSKINPQQKDYNWLTVELHKWKMFDGKMSEGLLYKPENFDSTKKYPVIFYFYERDADTRYNYRSPAPSASTVNIPYFVSNGYIVFDPDIFYKNGEPGASAYNSIVSAARYLSKMKWVDSTKMAIQGQSWGGYQVAYLVTKTKMFAAAGAGAPVSNMFSAYGGIRWGAGISRQFQYERSQTRIGYTPWQRPDLYTKNSPLFTADKVSTPLLLMHNDKDGAVPWYQSIEYFTALRRLGKKVWLLQYNDEDHNLVERRNRKDLSIRLGQFFDHYLKGKPAAKWMIEGVPAISKGIDWGLEIK